MKHTIHFMFVLLLLVACQTTPEVSSLPSVQPTVPQQPAAPSAKAMPSGLLLDPANAGDESQEINAKIYETLPVLSVGDVVVSDDGLSYAFRLRQSVTFHDGTPLNADAVVLNFNRWYDPQNSLHGAGQFAAWKAAFEGFKGGVNADGRAASIFDGIEKVDEYTVLIHLNRPDANFLTKIENIAFGIASPAALTQAGADYGRMKSPIAGTGPYRVASWTDQGLTLEPNLAYWGEIPTQGIEFK